jgi:hypothetical protein
LTINLIGRPRVRVVTFKNSLKGISLGEGGHTFEESLREGEGACIPRRSVGLEEEIQYRGFGMHPKEWD